MAAKKSANSGLSINWTERSVAVADLRPYERNPRKISKAAFEKLKKALQESGYHQRIVAQPDLRVIGGHQRIRALTELGVVNITVLVPDRELTIEEFRKLLIQDNLPFGDFDFEMLEEDFSRAELADFGMPEAWLDDFGKASHNGLTDPDDVPDLAETAISVLGDVWQLGDHRIVCGDSTTPSAIDKVLTGERPVLMVTDPPYGVNYDPAWRRKAGVGSKDAAEGAVLNDDRADWGAAWALFPGNVCYVWHGGLHAATVAKSLEEYGFKVRAQIVWVKTRPALSRGHYHWQHEPALYAQKDETDDNWRFGGDHEDAAYAVRDGHAAAWRGGRKQTTVWFIDHLKNDTGHSTQKPVMCMQRPILNNSDKGQAVYDPFLGSGSTIIAAEMTGRKCFGCELNPLYVDLIVRRWQAFTGRDAIRIDDGKTFTEAQQ